MTVATVTSKGQITLPAAIRADLHIGKGDRIEFIKVGEGRYELIVASNDIKVLKGLVKTRKKVSLEAMDLAIKAMSARLAPEKKPRRAK